MNTGKIILSILAGVTAGATLGVLFAPDKGLSIRKKIARKSNAYAQGISDQLNAIVSQIGKSFELLRDEAIQTTEQKLEHAKQVVVDMSSADQTKTNRQKEYTHEPKS